MDNNSDNEIHFACEDCEYDCRCVWQGEGFTCKRNDEFVGFDEF